MSEQSNDKRTMPLASSEEQAPAPVVPVPNNPKHKRVITGPASDVEIDDALNALKLRIKALPDKQQHIFCDWVKARASYFQYEPGFKPERLMKYNRGDIVLVELGYNIGSEYGGKRYAVVVEKNTIYRPVVTVIPITTLERGKPKESLHDSEVYLGEILPGAESYAIPLHMRTISKLRIIKPKSPPPLKRLSTEQLDSIDAVVGKYFTK